MGRELAWTGHAPPGNRLSSWRGTGWSRAPRRRRARRRSCAAERGISMVTPGSSRTFLSSRMARQRSWGTEKSTSQRPLAVRRTLWTAIVADMSHPSPQTSRCSTAAAATVDAEARSRPKATNFAVGPPSAVFGRLPPPPAGVSVRFAPFLARFGPPRIAWEGPLGVPGRFFCSHVRHPSRRWRTAQAPRRRPRRAREAISSMLASVTAPVTKNIMYIPLIY